MKFVQIPAPDFDLATTLNCGQVFHWEKIDKGFCGTIGDRAIYVEQVGKEIKVRCGETSQPPRETRALPRIVADYFALDHPLAEICASFPDDLLMNTAGKFCRGLRIIRQPYWECLATFVTSSWNSVTRVQQISRALRERFGARSKIDSYAVHTFPSARRMAGRSERDLLQCGLGYRAKNLLATARLVANGDVDLEKMAELSDTDLRRKLWELPGVRTKVANCVMLFAYERLRAFPIDVWIERVLREKYLPRARKLNASRLRAFTEEYFGPYGGYAQQYLFHYARKGCGNLSPRCR